MQDKILDRIRDAEMVLVGLGEEFDQAASLEMLVQLAELLQPKNYFVVSTTCNPGIRGICWKEGRLVDMQGAGEQEYLQRWQTYTKWLQGTLTHSLLLLELGVGMLCPSAIRWPFEKIALYHQKAFLCRIHGTLSQLPEGLMGKGISIAENAIAWCANLC